MSAVSLIFPMAGDGSRFGYRFKPFLDFNGERFIAAAFAPFRKWQSRIARVYFVYRRDQEEAHDVSAELSRMFADVAFTPVILDRPTVGPAQTLGICLTRTNIQGPIIVGDCDHALDVNGLMQATQDPDVACAVPTWDLAGESLKSWSVAAIGPTGSVVDIAEKQMPGSGEVVRGVIGCYYFADADVPRRIIGGDKQVFLSDVVRSYIDSGAGVRSVPVVEARFFGDPSRLQRALATP